ncbi:MAG: hypothetical protein WB696_00540 [Chthoniobacterales bacterium]
MSLTNTVELEPDVGFAESGRAALDPWFLNKLPGGPALTAEGASLATPENNPARAEVSSPRLSGREDQKSSFLERIAETIATLKTATPVSRRLAVSRRDGRCGLNEHQNGSRARYLGKSWVVSGRRKRRTLRSQGSVFAGWTDRPMKRWLAHWAFLLGLFFIGSFWTQRGSSAEFERIGIVSAFEMIFPDDVRVVRKGDARSRQVHAFPADRHLLGFAESAANRVRLVDAKGEHRAVYIGGNAMSGPVFLDNRDFREFAFRTWKVRLHEMEGTAIAQVGYVNRVPVLIVRGISDLAGGQRRPNWEET